MTGNAIVLLSDVGMSQDVGETLMQMRPGSASGAMDLFAQLPSTCAKFSGTIDGIDVAFHLTSGSFSTLGSRTVALELTADVSGLGMTLTEDDVFVQYKNTIIAVSNQGSPTDSSLTKTAVDKAYAKVTAAW